MAFATEPQPGQFGLVRIGGTTGKLISIGQRLIGSGSTYTHAFMVVDNGMVIQGEPGGAKLVPLEQVVSGRTAAYSAIPLDSVRRASVIEAAHSLAGTPYSYLDYLAIGAARIARTAALERFVSASGHMICSQLVDETYRRAGIELFPGRIAGDVAPGDLARLIGA